MTKRKRIILFLVCLFLFLLAAPLVLLYNQGYRFDFQNRNFSQTGGLFLKVLPKQAEIYLNGKLVKKTDFFFGSVLVENLLPQKYKVEVKKEGYFSWQKILEVKEKEVAEAKSIILLPEKVNFNILTKDLEDFWFSPDQKKIILKEREKNDWSLKLYELEKNIKSHLISQKNFSLKGAELMKLEFPAEAKNSKELSLEIGMAEKLKYFSLEIDKIPPVLKEISEPSPLGNILTYQRLNNNIYYLDNLGNIFRTDSAFNQKEKIGNGAFPVQPETEYELAVFPNYLFLKEGQTLYYLNPDSKQFEKFFDNINNLKISPDSKKIAYFSDYEIWIFYLKESGPEKKAGDRVFLTRLSEKIQDLFWLNSSHLVFNAGDNIKISEIDDRDKINIVDIARYKNPKIFWNQNDKKIYILSEGNLYSSEKLLP